MERAECDELGDMILNESFREFVENTNPDSVRIWTEWIVLHPERRKEIEDAASVLKTLLNKKNVKVPVDKNESLLKLMRRINEEQPEPVKSIRLYNSIWLKIAAVGLLIIGLSTTINLFRLQKAKNSDLVYNEIIVPLGEKAQIVLSDGSHVWINSDSKLRYPVKFGETSRDVTLEGEAFFDVAKQHGKTFVVNTRDVKVNVLGTAFNVKCYPGDDKTQTIVVRGKVRVEDINGKLEATILKPNEMATFNDRQLPDQPVSNRPAIKVDKVDPANLISWKDQMLVFAGETMEDLSVKMERWFNVKIRIDDEKLKSERYNGKFGNETIYQVLEAIKITTPISYKVINDTIIITREEVKYHNL